MTIQKLLVKSNVANVMQVFGSSGNVGEYGNLIFDSALSSLWLMQVSFITSPVYTPENLGITSTPLHNPIGVPVVAIGKWKESNQSVYQNMWCDLSGGNVITGAATACSAASIFVQGFSTIGCNFRVAAFRVRIPQT